MNFFEKELHRFTGKDTAFKSIKPLYVGRACFLPLSGSRRARMEFVTCGTADRFEALDVTILSTTDGKVDHLRLRFKDYFTAQVGSCAGTCIPFSGSTGARPSGTSSPPLRKSRRWLKPPTTTSCSLPELLNREEGHHAQDL